MISLKTKGNFNHIDNFFEKVKDGFDISILDKYGKEGVEALRLYTPKRTGKTSESWYYETNRTPNGVSISFHNSNINDGVPIAIILQYGHLTPSGGWVEGVDYINPAIKPIFDKIAKNAWKEVNK